MEDYRSRTESNNTTTEEHDLTMNTGNTRAYIHTIQFNTFQLSAKMFNI